MTLAETNEFLMRAEQIGFVDAEGSGTDRLLFNGNLFRRDNAAKSSVVLQSLSSTEQIKSREFWALLLARGCIDASEAESVLGTELFEKLKAAGVYDLNTVSNDSGEHVFVTSPAAFHKYVDPLVDDCFDLAKALVSALTYGMTKRNPYHGRIVMIEALLQKLIRGHTVGPATAIGMDYKVLELSRVVQIIPNNGLYSMRLLKKEIGELALQVLTVGDANAISINTLPEAPMNAYAGPEETRMSIRRRQSAPSKKATHDILSALRAGRSF